MVEKTVATQNFLETESVQPTWSGGPVELCQLTNTLSRTRDGPSRHGHRAFTRRRHARGRTRRDPRRLRSTAVTAASMTRRCSGGGSNNSRPWRGCDGTTFRAGSTSARYALPMGRRPARAKAVNIFGGQRGMGEREGRGGLIQAYLGDPLHQKGAVAQESLPAKPSTLQDQTWERETKTSEVRLGGGGGGGEREVAAAGRTVPVGRADDATREPRPRENARRTSSPPGTPVGEPVFTDADGGLQPESGGARSIRTTRPVLVSGNAVADRMRNDSGEP